jgi:Flp pilus assembly protein TadB
MKQGNIVNNGALTAEQFVGLLLIFIAILALVYFTLDMIEKAKVKKLSKPKFIYLKSGFLNKYIDKLFEIKVIEKYIKELSYKISYFNSDDARVNYRNSFLMVIAVILLSISLFIVMVLSLGGTVWYLYALYIVMIVLVIYILMNTYADMKESVISKQLPEALNDLKIAYDNTKRLKLAVIQSYQDMPKEIRKEFARIAESDNLEESILYLREKIRNQWFKMVLTLMLLAVQKGDKEGALSEQLQNLNGIISQEILIKESNRAVFQLYKMFVLGAPFMAMFMKGQISAISADVAKYYSSVSGQNALGGLIIACLLCYFILDTVQKI